MKEHNIYISYCQCDKTIARSISEKLKSLLENSNVFFDEEVLLGEVHASKIVQAINDADVFICLIGEKSLKNFNFQTKEIELAIQRNALVKDSVKILPIILPRVNIEDCIKNQLFRYYNFYRYSPNIEDEILHVIQRPEYARVCSSETCEESSVPIEKKASKPSQNSQNRKRGSKNGCFFIVVTLLLVMAITGILIANLTLSKSDSSPDITVELEDSDKDNLQISRPDTIWDETKKESAAPNRRRPKTSHQDSIMYKGKINGAAPGLNDESNSRNMVDENNENSADTNVEDHDDYSIKEHISGSNHNDISDEQKENYDESIIIPTEADDEGKIGSYEHEVESMQDSKDENDGYIFLLGCISGLALGIIYVFVLRWRKKSTLKVSANKKCAVSVDGKRHINLNQSEVGKIRLNKGKYIIDFVANDEKERKRFTPEIKKKGLDDALVCDFSNEVNNERKILNIFIAGSTKLETERNAIRAGISMIYNQWRKHNFAIFAYTYEDFSKTLVIDGQQRLYDEFIKRDTSIAVFILDKTIGEKTREEFFIAYEACKCNGHPRILVYAKDYGEDDSRISEAQQLMDEINNYYITYKDTEHLRQSFMITLDWELINLYQEELTNKR